MAMAIATKDRKGHGSRTSSATRDDKSKENWFGFESHIYSCHLEDDDDDNNIIVREASYNTGGA
jgi:hypothetical protein